MNKISKKYYILVGKYEDKNSPFSMIFGDYDKSVVEDEKEDTSDHVAMRVITLLTGSTAEIYATLDKLNG